MAWVGFAEQDPAKTVRTAAHYGHEEGFLAAAQISWADSQLGRGPTGTAIRAGTVQINQNFVTDPDGRASRAWPGSASPSRTRRRRCARRPTTVTRKDFWQPRKLAGRTARNPSS